MEQKNIISNENERKQRPCPVCLEMIDETAETCPYCDEPTYFKHAHTNDTAAARAIDNEPAKEGMSLWKKVLIGFGCILAALFVIGLFLPDDESKDVAAADTEQLLDESSSSSDGSSIGEDSVDTIAVEIDGIDETDIAADSEDYKSFSTDLENFIQNMQECIDGGLPSTSTIGSHYAEARQGLWIRYNQLVPEMTKEQQEYAYTLLRVIDEMFEKWEEKDKEIFDLE